MGAATERIMRTMITRIIGDMAMAVEVRVSKIHDARKARAMAMASECEPLKARRFMLSQ